MFLEEIKQIKTGERELRKFGLLVGGVFAALGLLMWLRGKPHFPYFLGPGVLLAGAGWLFPKVLRGLYIVWMSLAIVMGYLVSNVILTLFFFLVITPIGLAARLAGKDFLQQRRNPQAASYWQRREHRGPKPPAEYERQF